MVFQEWCEEVVDHCIGPCQSVVRIEVEAADGGSGRQERISVVFSFQGGA